MASMCNDRSDRGPRGGASGALTRLSLPLLLLLVALPSCGDKGGAAQGPGSAERTAALEAERPDVLAGQAPVTAAGKVIAIGGDVTARRATPGATARKLALADEVFGDDQVETAAEASVTIALHHNGARWTLGPSQSRRVDAGLAWRAPRASEEAMLARAPAALGTAAAGRHSEHEAASTTESQQRPQDRRDEDHDAPGSGEEAEIGHAAPGQGLGAHAGAFGDKRKKQAPRQAPKMDRQIPEAELKLASPDERASDGKPAQRKSAARSSTGSSAVRERPTAKGGADRGASLDDLLGPTRPPRSAGPAPGGGRGGATASPPAPPGSGGGGGSDSGLDGRMARPPMGNGSEGKSGVGLGDRWSSGPVRAEVNVQLKVIHGSPSPKQRETITQTALNRLRRCGQLAGKENPSVAGKLVVRLTFDSEGKVTNAEVMTDTLNSKILHACGEGALRSIRLGPLASGVVVEVVAIVRLKAEPK